jgi:serine/threonine-protein kinase
MTPSQIDFRQGTELAGYRIESVLGRGGMGVVYLADDLRLERRVALKLITPELAADPRFRERFLRESRLAASLDHSHVVPVFAAGETDDQLWIAMRYVQGIDLKPLLEREGPLEPARALALVAQVASALDAAHAHGLLHRDVKPANVLVTEEDGEEHCYLSDFGLARSADTAAGPQGAPHLSGTVDYTAPEQIAHEVADHRADLYSLACILYECLAGEPPFKRPRPMATLFAHSSEPPPSLHERQLELPEAIDAVLAKALAKDPAERYPSCHVLVQDARDALGLAERRLSRRRLLLVGGAAGLGLAAAAAVPSILVTRGSSGGAPASVLPLAASSLVRIDPTTNELTGAVRVGTVPRALAIADGSVWVHNADDRTVSEIAPGANVARRTLDVSEAGLPYYFAAGNGAVWLADRGDTSFADHLPRVWRLDSATGRLSMSPVRNLAPFGIAVDRDALWLMNLSLEPLRWQLLRLRSSTGDLEAIIDGPDQTASHAIRGAGGVVAVGGGRLWVIEDENVWQVDPAQNRVVELRQHGLSEHGFFVDVESELDFGASSLWITNPDDDTVWRVDTSAARSAAPVRVGRVPEGIAYGAGSVWVATSRDRTVTRIDPETLDVQTIEVGGTPHDVAVTTGGVWVAVQV